MDNKLIIKEYIKKKLLENYKEIDNINNLATFLLTEYGKILYGRLNKPKPVGSIFNYEILFNKNMLKLSTNDDFKKFLLYCIGSKSKIKFVSINKSVAYREGNDIVINLNDIKNLLLSNLSKPQEEFISIIKDNLLNILSHELTHLYEHYFRGGKEIVSKNTLKTMNSVNPNDIQSKIDYTNLPHEFRSYFSGALSEIIKEIPNFKTFNEFYDKIMSGKFNKSLSYLNDKNNKKFLKMLSYVWDKFKNQ